MRGRAAGRGIYPEAGGAPPWTHFVGGIPRDFIQHYTYCSTYVQLPLASHLLFPARRVRSFSVPRVLFVRSSGLLWMLSPNESLSLSLSLCISHMKNTADFFPSFLYRYTQTQPARRLGLLTHNISSAAKGCLTSHHRNSLVAL